MSTQCSRLQDIVAETVPSRLCLGWLRFITNAEATASLCSRSCQPTRCAPSRCHVSAALPAEKLLLRLIGSASGRSQRWNQLLFRSRASPAGYECAATRQRKESPLPPRLTFTSPMPRFQCRLWPEVGSSSNSSSAAAAGDGAAC